MTDQLSATFQALSNPTRRAILTRLMDGEATVHELADPLPISQPAVSRHLKVLEHAGLIERRRDAQRRWCRIRGGPLKEVITWTTEFQRLWDDSFARLDALLDEQTASRGRHAETRPREETP